ncbi:MAG: hypothetical protein SH817_03470 [Leptospira sp.]|nr:hypothetical protein [Leptospira sp.]
MLSYEQNNLKSEPAIIPTSQLNRKLESFTNDFLARLKKEEKTRDVSWQVIDLQGKVLASGASPIHDKHSEFLF